MINDGAVSGRFSAPSCARAASVFEIRITSSARRLLSIARNLLAVASKPSYPTAREPFFMAGCFPHLRPGRDRVAPRSVCQTPH
jgi:hypothetical protein